MGQHSWFTCADGFKNGILGKGDGVRAVQMNIPYSCEALVEMRISLDRQAILRGSRKQTHARVKQKRFQHTIARKHKWRATGLIRLGGRGGSWVSPYLAGSQRSGIAHDQTAWAIGILSGNSSYIMRKIAGSTSPFSPLHDRCRQLV